LKSKKASEELPRVNRRRIRRYRLSGPAEDREEPQLAARLAFPSHLAHVPEIDEEYGNEAGDGGEPEHVPHIRNEVGEEYRGDQGTHQRTRVVHRAVEA
jgi:hypothetical protein